MRLSRWMLVIGIMVGLGCLQVAQRNAILLKSYGVGERMNRIHARQTELAWLQAHVTELSSPTHLAQMAQERRLKLVAWWRLPPTPSMVSAALLPRAAVREDVDGSSDE